MEIRNDHVSGENEKTRKRTVPWKALLQEAVILLTGLVFLLCFSIRWALNTWEHLSMDELVFHLSAPLDGTNPDMIREYLLVCALPALLLAAVVFLAVQLAKKRNQKALRWILGATGAVAAVSLAGSVYSFWTRLDIGTYLANAGKESDFIRENYIDPADVSITFPEKDRNLLLIFLESMETTYADKESGGAFEKNVIPGLTGLAEAGEDFSGSAQTLNGGLAMPGATFTIGAMFAQTSALPLKINIGHNNMDLQESFFSGVRCLGDILEDRGYNQSLLIGSQASFGGRKLYFSEHGDFDILDYDYALKNGLIPAGYHVFWGYEDDKLFTFAKDKLLSLSQDEEPFHLTMLTVDTHFEDGYVCESCTEEFGDNQYANVIACSDRKVTEFIEWVKQQEFYNDTAVVIVGDHLTMDSDFCQDVDESYQRKVYTAYINAACEPSDPARVREYTTFDTFPTILAAMGADIEGDRLGLGTNLFSETDTLAEKFGEDYMVSELNQKSAFMEQMGNIDIMDESLMRREGRVPQLRISEFYEETGILTVEASNIKLPGEQVTGVELEYGSQGSKKGSVVLMEPRDEIYKAALDISSLDGRMGYIRLWIQGENGEKYKAAEWNGYLPLLTADITD